MRLRNAVLILLAAMFLGFGSGAMAAEKTIGVVFSGDLSRYQEAHKAFVTALAKAGFDQGKVSIYVQTPNPDPMSWANSARKFVAVEVDVIVAYGAPAALAALKETSTIPVVFSYVYDPQACGVKKKNSTGVSSKVPMVTLLRTLKNITPFSKLAVVYNPDEKDSTVQRDEIVKDSSALGYQVVDCGVRSSAEVKARVAKAAGAADGLYISCSAAANRESAGVIGIANREKIPVVTQVSGMAEKGVLLALAPSSAEQGEIAAAQVARILRGENPAAMPIENARRVDLVLNLKAANELGLKVPFDVLNAATKVIK
jgi:ABC-type uncharacterized transport system substrate-binding protein